MSQKWKNFFKFTLVLGVLTLILAIALFIYIYLDSRDADEHNSQLINDKNCIATYYVPPIEPSTLFNEADFVQLQESNALAEERQLVGQLTQSSLAELNPRELLEFLLLNEHIKTYKHLFSEVCLVDEEITDSKYKAELRGQHTYTTSETVTKEYEFMFEIDKKTGQVYVE